MFHKIVLTFVILLTLADMIILAGVFGVQPFDNIIQHDMSLYVSLMCIQLPIFYYIIYRAYISPIEKLKKGIARFHTGLDDNPNLLANSWSKWMNDVIIFFQKSLNILRAFKSELRAGRQLRSEVEIASEIQKQTLSRDEDAIPGLDVAVGICSASEVGGDSVDIIKWQDENYYLYVGDVTGHGVPSGFVMMMVNALIAAFSKNFISGADILANANFVLKPRIKQNMMMTCVMLRWDNINKKMYYTGAWHEFILVYKVRDKKVYKIKTGGVAIGMVKNISRVLKEQQIAFEPGDIIVLYTDGITEARYRSEQTGILFGVDRIIESITKVAPQNRNPKNIFKQITIDLSAFMGYKYKQYDDITLVVATYNPPDVKSNMMIDLSKTINPSLITEWNWGNKI